MNATMKTSGKTSGKTSQGRQLKYGYTTGSSATAAAHAGLLYLLSGASPGEVTILTPLGKKLTLPIHAYEDGGNAVRVTVIKDGGDDPDVTHKTPIQCVVSVDMTSPVTEVVILGGKGVGKVTRPGLPVPVGEPAINPAPRAQIAATIENLLAEHALTARVQVVVEVPEGKRLAQKTLNPRLGIEGGISILGTRGTVKPFSNAAYVTTIKQCLHVARSLGLTSIAFATGGRSEGLLRNCLSAWPEPASPEPARLEPAWPEEAFITVADFFAQAMHLAAKQGIKHVVWGVFPGKLVKQALGHANTHARHAAIDFSVLSEWWTDLHLSPKMGERIAKANTAMQVQNLIAHEPGCQRYYNALIHKARQHALQRAKASLCVDYCLFDMAGNMLATTLDDKEPAMKQ